MSKCKATTSPANVAPRRSYRYASLQSQPLDTTRLLIVYSGKSDVVECSLLTAALDAQPKFKALSYTWGNQPCDQQISIDGSVFMVRPSLWALLKRLQHQDKPTIIWIDAICVNQNDLAERKHQVGLMRKIYTQAELVIAWLGEMSRETEEALAADLFILRHGKEADQRTANETITDAALAGLDDLASRGYWRRAWIVQELVLARTVSLWFGTKGVMSFHEFVGWGYRE